MVGEENTKLIPAIIELHFEMIRTLGYQYFSQASCVHRTELLLTELCIEFMVGIHNLIETPPVYKVLINKWF